MDKEVLRLLAHLDQTRAQLRDVLAEMPDLEVARLIKTCAAAKLQDMDAPTAQLVGLLAVVAIIDLGQPPTTEGSP